MQELAQKIRVEIQSRGVIPFHDFMQMALYCPVYGYYEKESDNIGSSGDFFTSASVGPLFGQLLAQQFSEWLECPESVLAVQPLTHTPPPRGPGLSPSTQLVEAGAHDGILAKDVLTWIQASRPALFDRLEYWIIEPSPFRRSRQQRTLANFGDKVRWTASFHSEVRDERGEGRAARQQPHATRNTQDDLARLTSSLSPPPPLFQGIIFSNELLDAFPVHRLGWDARQRSWFEWGVALKDDQFVWTRMTQVSPVAARLIPKLPDELMAILPDGFTSEISSEAVDWWRRAGKSLGRGKLVAIDYGLEAEEFFEPHRAQGTLRAYRKHHGATDILADPGEQDITAHVNFSALKEMGESCGLITESLQTQSQFLTRILAKLSESASAWTQEQTRQFQTLTHPDHLGRAFRVLIQERRNVRREA